ncbi:transmembrane protein 65-like isoform X2 [Scaptodrosophila lebanonensis]|uniref:Transmembrane protein 65-like isoform X2 n=1 Tax=Drosophila lebanonensis TaxID=7225 RepID=A0A6J2TQV7_DROLE|nr:transmembrane protein 65-like isoform X2 [Scaptodrosophila lebanonensis]
MRQQCQGAFKQLVRHWQEQHPGQHSLFCRRLAHSPTSYFTCTNNRTHLLLHRPTVWQQDQHSKTFSQSSFNQSKFSTHLSTERAMELICNLDEEERINLRQAMVKIDAEKEKKQYEMETARPPTTAELGSIFFVNAVPFIVFGFLDNFIMIVAGEYIDYYLGHFITLSTMAAAGLGNTISDVLGISMATYVENGCQIIGLRPPKLTPAQFELKSSRRASSWGRIIGITIGCLLGMCPLWFSKDEPKPEEAEKGDSKSIA